MNISKRWKEISAFFSYSAARCSSAQASGPSLEGGAGRVRGGDRGEDSGAIQTSGACGAARSRHCDRGCTGRGCREQAQVNAAMVKISFQPAVAGIKADKADKAAASGPASASAPAAEILLTPAREERPPRHRSRKGGSVGGVCYLSMGMVVLLMGLVFASVYIYRYFFLAQLARDNFFHCGVLYEDSLSSQIRTRLELEEDVKIYLEENYERINVPVPQFGGGDPADIIHDFQRGLTAYHDISLDKCYVIELNTTIVLPPRNFWELLMNVKRGTYLPQTYIIQEEMVVTEHVRDKEALGSFIYHLCNGKDTYRLRRRSTRRRINKRGAKNCNAIRHFENTFVVETLICGVV
uniref:Integral membrane protein 2 n=2 Tax=Mus TaxID=862507 RepID=A0A8C6GAA8_MUSSI